MASSFLGIEIGKRSLSAHQQALQTTGHNISNADNKGYARQRVEIQSMSPLYAPSMNRAHQAGTIGQGVEISSITRIRDKFIDERIYNTENTKGYWELKQKYLREIEITYNEPANESIHSQISKFWGSWQELSQYPEERSHRNIVKTNAKELSFKIRNVFEQIFQMRQHVDEEITSVVSSTNAMTKQIADLNERIQKSMGVGDKPNDLLDQRDAILQKLSSMVDVTIKQQDKDEIMIFLGSEILVQGNRSFNLKAKIDDTNTGMKKIVWENNGQNIVIDKGQLRGLLEIRDITLKEHLQQMNLLSINLSDIVNEVHRDGFGLNQETNIDFFDIKSLSKKSNANIDLNNDGQEDTTAIFRVTGRHQNNPDKPLGINGVMTFHSNNTDHTPIYINYHEYEKLSDIVSKINRSDAGVVAYVNHNHNLVLKARLSQDDDRSHFMIRHMEDSGELLAGYTGILNNAGVEGAFDYHRINEIAKLQSNLDKITFTPERDSAYAIRVNQAIDDNVDLIASTSGRSTSEGENINQVNGLKDGSNAIAIAKALKHNSNMIGTYNNVDDFYNTLISKLGMESKVAQDELSNQSTILNNLDNLRQSIMGVNLDEEMANMLKFQHGYNASARIVKVMSEMLDRLINQLG